MHSTNHQILQVRNVSKRFADHVIMHNVDFGCGFGEVKALVGPNGAGKTTLFNIVGGYLPPDEGEVLLRKRSVLGLAPHRIAKLGVSRLFQNLRLFDNLSVLDNVLVPLTISEDERPLAAFLRPGHIRKQEEHRTLRAQKMLSEVRLLDHARCRARDLSFGQQKLLALVRTFAMGGELLLLDEPSAGLDPSMAACICSWIRDAAAAGKGVILIEHDLAFVAEVTSQVVLLARGRILREGDLKKLMAEQIFRDVFLGPPVAKVTKETA